MEVQRPKMHFRTSWLTQLIWQKDRIVVIERAFMSENMNLNPNLSLLLEYMILRKFLTVLITSAESGGENALFTEL